MVRKSLIVAVLLNRGLTERADWVDRTMPEDIDVHRNASLFDMLGIDPETLTEQQPTRRTDPTEITQDR